MAPEIVAAQGADGGREGQARDDLTVTLATDRQRGEWNAFVDGHPDACGYHEWEWRRVFEASFGHECLYLVARRGNRVEGILPLVFIKSWLFGRSMTSLPFLNYGGALAESDAASRALLETAATLAQERRCRHIELRHTARHFDDLPCRQHKVSMRLSLRNGLWDSLDRKVRNQIRKAEKSQLTVSRGGAELLDDFYAVFARNMRDLGTPVYARRFFDEVLDAFPDRVRVLVVRLKDVAVAAGLTYRTGTTTEVPWASSVRDYNSLCPNHLLYWHAIESAVAEGCEVFDFGRSTPNEGTYRFKEQWGATPLTLHWEYVLFRGGRVPDQSPKNPKFRLAIAAWRRLPVSLTKAVGPPIVRSIP